jgi:SAM-dependent methyltransferase
MDRTTVERYESDGARWAANRAPVRQKDAKGFARRVGRTGLRLDVGAGAGRYTADLGPAGTVLAFDAAHTMLGLLRADHPDAPAVQGDVEALPFRRGTLGGAWANMTYHHLPGAGSPSRWPISTGPSPSARPSTSRSSTATTTAPTSPATTSVAAGSARGRRPTWPTS